MNDLNQQNYVAAHQSMVGSSIVRILKNKKYSDKLERELGWKSKETFETGLRKKVLLYLEHEIWVNHIVSGEYQHWVQKQYS